jgi:alkyl hydroperoxide reductase subunit D
MSLLETQSELFLAPMRDIKLNLQTLLSASESLTTEQRLGVALASAIAARHAPLTLAVLERTRADSSEAVVEDAIAAASLMAMNNVYYRFRHMLGKPSYSEKPARLRMTRIARPSTNKADFELMCLAVSAINGCEACVRAHEQTVIGAGLSEDQVHDAVRIAATVQAAALCLEISEEIAGAVRESAP